MDSALVTVLANAGVAGVVVILIIAELLVPRPAYRRALEDSARKDAEIAKLEEALALERQRSNDATQAATVTNQLISGLVRLAAERHEEHSRSDGAALNLTREDLGL